MEQAVVVPLHALVDTRVRGFCQRLASLHGFDLEDLLPRERSARRTSGDVAVGDGYPSLHPVIAAAWRYCWRGESVKLFPHHAACVAAFKGVNGAYDGTCEDFDVVLCLALLLHLRYAVQPMPFPEQAPRSLADADIEMVLQRDDPVVCVCLCAKG